MEALLEIVMALLSFGFAALASILMVVISLVASLAPTALIVLLVMVGLKGNQERDKKFRALLVDELGLVRESSGYSGILDGASVRMHRWSSGGKHKSYYTDFSAATGIDGLSLSSSRTLFAKRDVSVGDPTFDETFRTYTHPEGLSCLSDDVRRELLAMRSMASVKHDNGVLTMTRTGQRQTPEEAVAFLQQVGGLAVRMQNQGGLRERVQGDSLGSVRWRMLAALEEVDLASAQQVARERMTRDGDPNVRLQAAMVLGDTPAMLRGVRDIAVDIGLREAGAQRLAGAALCEAVAVFSADPQLWVAGVNLATGHESAEMSNALSRYLEPDGMVQAAVQTGRYTATCERLARSFGRGPSGPLASQALLALLSVDDADVRRASIQSLAVMGSVADIPALRAFEGELGLFDGGLKLVVGQAVARIQARRGGSTGDLSIVDNGDQVGAVSLAANAQRGRVPERGGR